MSKKNSNVILKSGFKNYKNLSEVYGVFKKKLETSKIKSSVVAVSGGPDSLALVALAKAYSHEKNIKFYFVLINHNIRKDSLKEANKVKLLLKRHNITLKVLSNREKILNNIQSNARNIRYKMLSKFCLKKKIKSILTAHNLEDQVETFFIRLSRGSGLTGLSSMEKKTTISNDIKLIRPLLDVKKINLINISKKIFGKYFKDPSNNDDKYLRTKIRALKKPLIASGINYEQIIKSINNLASSKKILDDYLKEILKNIAIKSKKEVLLNLSKFKILNNELKMRVLNESIKILRKNYYNPRSKKVLSLVKNLSKKNFKKATLGGCIFLIKNDQICLKKEKIVK